MYDLFQIALSKDDRGWEYCMFEADAPPAWRDLASLKYQKGEIVSRTTLQWPLLAAALTSTSSEDAIEMDLSAPFGRLSFDLEFSGKAPPTILSAGQKVSGEYAPINLIAPSSNVRLNGDQLRYYHHLVVQFSIPEVTRHYDSECDARSLTSGRLGFNDHRLMRIAQLLVTECTSSRPTSRLYIDSLSLALFSALVLPEDVPEVRGGLAPWQLRRVLDHLQANITRDVPLADLAGIAKLSTSYFCRAFRTSVGVTPHQWQLNARIEVAKNLMMDTSHPLSLIALETGFSDQAHFSRVFRKVTGFNPLSWLKSRCQ